MLGEPPFDPVACPGITYGFHHYSEADQKLETANSCDNYAIRPMGGYVYRIGPVRGAPGSYHIEIYLVKADRRKEKLNSWIFSDQFSNGYGFGIPDAGKIAGKATTQSE
jgi:hypothetical protein